MSIPFSRFSQSAPRLHVRPSLCNAQPLRSPVRLRRHRLIAGVNYRYEMVMAGGQFMMDLIPPADAQPDAQDKIDLKDEDQQFAFVFELGAMF